ncbi:hypothetical protein [Gordonia aichiensis]|uniref:hypothetical protein n=2 Tax=Gordonia TaxID=2053 RepID=UPI003265E5C6
MSIRYRSTAAAAVVLMASACAPDQVAAPSSTQVRAHTPASPAGAAVHHRFVDGPPPDFATVDRGRSARPGFVVRAGVLTHAAPTAPESAAYLWARPPRGSVTRIGATAVFPAADAGSVALLVTSAPVPAAAGGAAPAASVHFVADADRWSYGVWPAGGRAQIVLAQGRYRSAIDRTAARFEVEVSGATATIVLPDGTAAVVTDHRIVDTRGAVATWELYESVPGLTPAGLTEVWMS